MWVDQKPSQLAFSYRDYLITGLISMISHPQCLSNEFRVDIKLISLQNKVLAICSIVVTITLLVVEMLHFPNVIKDRHHGQLIMLA